MSQPSWPKKIGEGILQRSRLRDVAPVIIRGTRPRHPSRLYSSPFIILVVFALLIVVGALLLQLPVANKAGTFTPASTAFFTATSAVTTTGLEVVGTATYWTWFGQAVILILIALGGLGIMTVATFAMLLLGLRITLPNRLLLRQSLGQQGVGGLIRLAVYIMALIVTIYVAGTAVLFLAFRPHFPEGTALWQALFHSIGAFNNAGLSILPNSANLSRFATNYTVIITMGFLIVLGGISYTVIIDLLRRRGFSRLSLDSKLVLTTSLALWVLGYLVMLVAELRNPSTLGNLPPVDRGMTALFHSVSSRTAGFSTLDFGVTEEITRLIFVGLMFIGGAVGSTAGGIKVNILAILLATVIAAVKGRPHVEAFGREIPTVQVHRAITIAFLGLALIFVVSLILTATETEARYINILFETVSAFGTVGLSTGITPELSLIGKALIMVTMFLGEFGPLTLVIMLAGSEERSLYRFAQERVKIG